MGSPEFMRFDFILSDWNMAPMDGVDFIALCAG